MRSSLLFLNDTRAFTLVELLIALGLMAFAGLAILSLEIHALRMVSAAAVSTEGAALLTRKMEEIQNTPLSLLIQDLNEPYRGFDRLSSFPPEDEDCDGREEVTSLSLKVFYRIYWNIAYIPEREEYKDMAFIRLEVQWDYRGNLHRLSGDMLKTAIL